MKTSARNQLSGKVSAVHKGAVNDEIELEIAGGVRIVATITAESTKRLGLAVGKEAVALIKASSVIVGVPDPDILLSARNQLAGTVAGIKIGAVNAEVSIGASAAQSVGFQIGPAPAAEREVRRLALQGG